MDTITEFSVPNSNIKDKETFEPLKSPERSPRRAARLLRRLSEETAHVFSRMTKSDSSLFMKRSKWKVVKNSLIFIKNSKAILEEKNEALFQTTFDMDEILTEELKKEICEVHGIEFDLYLHCLRWRNFDAPPCISFSTAMLSNY